MRIVVRLDARLALRDEDQLPDAHHAEPNTHHRSEKPGEQDKDARRVQIWPGFVDLYRRIGYLPPGANHDDAREAEPRHKQHKVSLIADADALIKPWAMVVLSRRISCQLMVISCFESRAAKLTYFKTQVLQMEQ